MPARAKRAIVCLILGIILGAGADRLLVRRTISKLRRDLADQCNHQYRTSMNLDEDWAKQFIIRRVETLSWPDEKGTTYAIAESNPEDHPEVSFITRKVHLSGKEPLQIPDHHGGCEVAVFDVVDNVAYIVLMNHSDSRSFGKHEGNTTFNPVKLQIRPATGERESPVPR